MNIRDTYSHGIYTMRSIFSSIPSDIAEAFESLKKEYLDQQVASLDYAISHNEEWNKDPTVVWKSIHTNSIKWCNEFQIPFREFHPSEA